MKNKRTRLRAALAAGLCVTGLIALATPARAFFGFDLPTTYSPTDITAGPDGNMWFTDPTHGLIGRITPDGTVTTFPVPGSPGGIISGPDGNLWVAETSGSKIAVVTTAGAVTTQIPVTGSAFGPTHLAVGPLGTIWYVDGTQVGTVLAALPHTLSLVTSVASAGDIIAGPDGNMWVTVPSNGMVVRIVAGLPPVVTSIQLPSGPMGITAGPDGSLWFTEGDNNIGRIRPGSTTADRYPIPLPAGLSSTFPLGITTGSDGNIWFVENATGDIGRFSPSDPNMIDVFSPPSSGRHPVAIAPDALGNLWIADTTSGGFSLIVPSGRYVKQVYHDLLGRAPEPDGLTFWVNTLDSGTPESAVATSFAGSYEYRAINVTADYNLLLHRSPDASGLAFWVNYIGSGATYEDLLASTIGSDEYYNVRGGGTVDGFVTAVYNDILGRAPDALGEQYWDGVISGGVPRYVIAQSFSHATEVLQKRVNADYLALLRRPADAAGLAYWVGRLQQGTRDEALIADLTGSNEYIFYVATHPTP